MEEKSRQVLGKTKKIKDATLIGKKTEIPERFKTDSSLDIEVEYEELQGEKDAPPLEITDAIREQLMEEEKEKEEKQREIRSKTQHFTNGVNEWKLIAKTYNDILDYEHVTTAMNAGKGCLVCVKEAIGQRLTSTVTYVPGINIALMSEGKYYFYNL